MQVPCPHTAANLIGWIRFQCLLLHRLWAIQCPQPLVFDARVKPDWNAYFSHDTFLSGVFFFKMVCEEPYQSTRLVLTNLIFKKEVSDRSLRFYFRYDALTLKTSPNMLMCNFSILKAFSYYIGWQNLLRLNMLCNFLDFSLFIINNNTTVIILFWKRKD